MCYTWLSEVIFWREDIFANLRWLVSSISITIYLKYLNEEILLLSNSTVSIFSCRMKCCSSNLVVSVRTPSSTSCMMSGTKPSVTWKYLHLFSAASRVRPYVVEMCALRHPSSPWQCDLCIVLVRSWKSHSRNLIIAWGYHNIIKCFVTIRLLQVNY